MVTPPLGDDKEFPACRRVGSITENDFWVKEQDVWRSQAQQSANSVSACRSIVSTKQCDLLSNGANVGHPDLDIHKPKRVSAAHRG